MCVHEEDSMCIQMNWNYIAEFSVRMVKKGMYDVGWFANSRIAVASQEKNPEKSNQMK